MQCKFNYIAKGYNMIKVTKLSDILAEFNLSSETLDFNRLIYIEEIYKGGDMLELRKYLETLSQA